MTATGAKEWTGGIGCGPRPRAQGAAAARKALEAVRALDVRLDALRPHSDETPPDGPTAHAWDALIGAIARAEMRADELVEAAAPFVAKKHAFVRRAPAPR